jgi:cysteine desulfurase/selenocysteine lyase
MNGSACGAAAFGNFDGRIWLNTADQGPLPNCAAVAAVDALQWKIWPSRMDAAQYKEVPLRLKGVLARLLGSNSGAVILGNSATYGFEILARSMAWSDGDEVLLVEGDFPANVTPWFSLAPRVRTTVIPLADWTANSTASLRQRLTQRSRVFCTSWVGSFSGSVTNLAEIGRVCRDNGVYFLVNGSQGVGSRPLDVSQSPVDAVTCSGSKWLCGPYGTGFCWVNESLYSTLRPVQHYWLAGEDERVLMRETRGSSDATFNACFDVFGTANFLNFVPWIASIELLLGIGIESISAYIDEWIDAFELAIDPNHFRIIRDPACGERSAIVILSHADDRRNEQIFAGMRNSGIDIALRRGKLRLSPHLFNSRESVQSVVDSFHRVSIQSG